MAQDNSRKKPAAKKSKTGTSKDSRSKDFRNKDSRSKDFRSKDSRNKDFRNKDSRSKDSRGKDSRSKDFRSKDFRSKDFRSKDSRNKKPQRKEERTRESRNRELRLDVTKPAGLLSFLLEQLPAKSRKEIKSLLAHHQVQVDGRVVSQFDQPLHKGQVITIRRGKVARGKKIPGLEILYEDAALLVVDKKAGLLSMATAKEREHTAYSLLKAYVRKKDPSHRLFIVHRLDRETSGILLFAKSKEVQQALQENWDKAVLERSYLAVVEATLAQPEGTVTSWLKENKNLVVYSSAVPGEGQQATTHYKVLKTGKKYSLLEARLETGRRNQIRVHMQDLGHSVVGDKKYGAAGNPLKRLGLHAHRLVFRHPATGKILRFETEVPLAFMRLFQEENRPARHEE